MDIRLLNCEEGKKENILIMGERKSGKTVLAKTMIIRDTASGKKVVVITAKKMEYMKTPYNKPVGCNVEICDTAEPTYKGDLNVIIKNKIDVKILKSIIDEAIQAKVDRIYIESSLSSVFLDNIGEFEQYRNDINIVVIQRIERNLILKKVVERFGKVVIGNMEPYEQMWINEVIEVIDKVKKVQPLELGNYYVYIPAKKVLTKIKLDI